MKVTDFIITPDWMLNLQLTDKQEKLYALIWGYSRNGRSRWRGTSRELATWLRCSERHAKRLVHELEDLGFISHEVIRTTRKTWTEFWAILPDDVQRPRRKVKIDWQGRDIHVTMGSDTGVPMGGDIHVPTDKIVISSKGSNKKRSCCCKNGAPAGAKTTTTTTGFLFENNESGLPAGKSAEVEPPFQEEFFLKEWRRLLEFWSEKSPAAISVIADKLKETGEASSAAYCCRLAVEREWDTIADPTAIIQKDIEQVIEYEKNLKWQGYDV